MQQKRGESARAEQRTVLYKSDYYPPQSYICESRRDEEEGGELDSQEEASPEEIKSREVVLGYRERELDFCFSCFPTGATDIVFVTLFCRAVGTTIAWC